MESMGEMEAALQFYEMAQDFLSLVRVYCYCSNMDKVRLSLVTASVSHFLVCRACILNFIRSVHYTWHHEEIKSDKAHLYGENKQ